jgi:hypothetical protein
VKETIMVKKAFCVGINDYPGDGSDLKGCVNDAQAWATLLVEHYDFPKDNVTLITDAQATKQNVINGIKNLIASSNPGDVLVFTNSSHGTYCADKSGDEPMYDEAICPYDVQKNLIVDDELRELFAGIADGVHLTVITDSCFSGTVTRALVNENFPGAAPDDRRVRFFNPALRGDPILANPWKALPKGPEKFPEESMKEILLSGCTDREYSFDALIDGEYHGAMTYYAIRAITQAGYQLTYAELHERLLALIDEAQFNQHPRLEGAAQNKQRPIFT